MKNISGEDKRTTTTAIAFDALDVGWKKGPSELGLLAAVCLSACRVRDSLALLHWIEFVLCLVSDITSAK